MGHNTASFCSGARGDGCDAIHVTIVIGHRVLLLHSVTFQAFTDTLCAVSHSVPLAPRASQPPQPCLCAWVLVRVALVYLWLVSQLVFPFTFMLLCDLPCMYAFHLISPRLPYPYVFHIWYLFLLFSPWLLLCIYKTWRACMFHQFVYWLWHHCHSYSCLT